MSGKNDGRLEPGCLFLIAFLFVFEVGIQLVIRYLGWIDIPLLVIWINVAAAIVFVAVGTAWACLSKKKPDDGEQ